jgi:hypothetical protein
VGGRIDGSSGSLDRNVTQREGASDQLGRTLHQFAFYGVVSRLGALPPTGERNGNYKHGRYTQKVAATRQWLREMTKLVRDLNNGAG